MDKDFMQLVYARCEKALTGDNEYMDLQNKCLEALRSNDMNAYDELTSAEACKAEELCYLQGYSDAMRMIMNLK